MPVYTFITKEGKTYDRAYRMGEAPDTIRVGGKIAVRSIAATHRTGRQGSCGDQAWPRLSDAAGVHPSQVADAQALDKKMGVPTSYSVGGRARFESSYHQKQWLKAHKMRNLDSYD